MRIVYAFILLILSTSTFAKDKSALDLVQEKQEFIVDSMQIANEYCTDNDGNFTNSTLSNTFLEISPSETVSCYDYITEIDLVAADFDHAIEGKAYDNLTSLNGSNNCPSQILIDLEVIRLERLATSLRSEAVGCENKQGILSCTGDIVCNLAESAVSIVSVDLIRHVDQISGHDLSLCSGNSRGNCFSSLIQGITDNLTVTWEGISNGAGKLIDGGKNLAIKTWENKGKIFNWFKEAPGRFVDWGAEQTSSAISYYNSFDDFSSMKMHMMSQLSDIEVEQWLKDKAAFVGDIFSKIFDSISNSFKKSLSENYGCQKWQNNKCIQPLNIDCMGCNDYFNAFCGFMGVATPEILLLYFTGGASAIARLGGRLASAVGNQAANLGKVMGGAVKAAQGANWSSKGKVLFSAMKLKLANAAKAIKNFVYTPGSILRKRKLPKAKSKKAAKTCSRRKK